MHAKDKEILGVVSRVFSHFRSSVELRKVVGLRIFLVLTPMGARTKAAQAMAWTSARFSTSPRHLSETNNWTPFSPRCFSSHRNAVQLCPSSLAPSLTPKNLPIAALCHADGPQH